MSETSLVDYRVENDVAYLRLNNPPVNIMTAAMMETLSGHLETIAGDRALKAVAVTGAGKAFCAGADVGEHEPDKVAPMIAAFGRLFRQLDESEANMLTYARKIKAAALGLESARIRKERGQTSYWELTTRESELVDAQTSFINGYLEYQKRLASLERASGARPDWGETPEPD